MKRFIHGASPPVSAHGGFARPGVRRSATVVTHNETVQHVGLVLPPAAKGHLSIKLDNGYNVSYPAEAVQEWELDPVKDASPSAELDPPTADEHSLVCA